MSQKILIESIKIFRTEMKYFVFLALIIWFPLNLLENWYHFYYSDSPEIWNVITNIKLVIFPIPLVAVIHLAYCQTIKQNCTFISGIQKGIECYFPLIKAHFFPYIRTLFGFFPLILPGFYYLTMYSLITPIVVVGKDRFINDPGLLSMQLTEGHKWKIFFTLFLLLFMNLFISFGVLIIFRPESIQIQIVYYTFQSTLFHFLLFPIFISLFLYYWSLKIKFYSRKR